MSRLKWISVIPEVHRAVNRKNETLGAIVRMPAWKCFVWEQAQEIVMSSDCLMEVVKKLEELDGKD